MQNVQIGVVWGGYGSLKVIGTVIVLTEREQTYNLRRRPHGSKTLLTKTQSLNEQDFFVRAMYKHSY